MLVGTNDPNGDWTLLAEGTQTESQLSESAMTLYHSLTNVLEPSVAVPSFDYYRFIVRKTFPGETKSSLFGVRLRGYAVTRKEDLSEWTGPLANPSSIVGPQGYQGPTGETGPQGAEYTFVSDEEYLSYRGPQGVEGTLPGIQGLQGFPGDQGYERGPQGVQGEPSAMMGTQGRPGRRGEQGYQGSPGIPSEADRGLQGFDGETGFRGPQGFPGIDSEEVGLEGSQGDPGDRGYAGNQGDAGLPGRDGLASSIEGPQGFQGAQGERGFPGEVGMASTIEGAQGDNGSEGLPSTIPGPQGFPGNQGPTGFPAADTPSTIPGPQGWPGSQGDPGQNGEWFLTGAQGADGRDATLFDVDPSFLLSGSQGYQGADAVPDGLMQGTQGFPGMDSTIFQWDPLSGGVCISSETTQGPIPTPPSPSILGAQLPVTLVSISPTQDWSTFTTVATIAFTSSCSLGNYLLAIQVSFSVDPDWMSWLECIWLEEDGISSSTIVWSKKETFPSESTSEISFSTLVLYSWTNRSIEQLSFQWRMQTLSGISTTPPTNLVPLITCTRLV
jgi:hypothetical protein